MANVITLDGGDIVVSAILDGGDIYPSGGGGGGLLQTKSVSYTPTESAQTDTVTADPGYDGLEEVDVTIGAISSTYVGSGVTRQAAQIIHPSTSDQSIPSGTYLTGTQGFKAVTTTNLTSGNIKNGVTVKVGDSSDDDRIISVTGTYSGGGANLESKSVSYTPTETAITALVTPSTGYDGLSQVDVTVGAISSSYVGSAVTRRDSSDLSASGAMVTAPSGYYASSASKAIPNASTPTIDSRSVDSSGYVSVDIEIDNGGYIAAGTYHATDSAPLPIQAAQTIYPSTSDQTIASSKYLTGAQTIKGVVVSSTLAAGNIKKDIVVEVGDSADPDRIVSVTGTYEGGGGGGYSADDIATRNLTGAISLQSTTTTIMNYAFAYASSLTSFSAPGVTTINAYAFYQDTGLLSVNLPVFVAQSGKGSVFRGCTSLAGAVLPASGGYFDTYFFGGCTNFVYADLNATNIRGDCFNGDTKMNILVLRNTSVPTLAHISAFTNTCFASGKEGGTLYVPNSLISSYQSASNWSTILGYATNSIQKIEGSYYETHYADGTVIS